ncbi:hypothetical protein MK489_02395 [Myxococcota bacterium]|nr:hypothetical protein [Myxococcota bacterium]
MSARGISAAKGREQRVDGRAGRQMGRRLGAALAAALLVLSLAAPGWAEDRPRASSDMVALDVLVFRPMHAVVFAVGSAAFVMTVPLPYMFGPSDNAVIHEAYDRLFRTPAKQLFLRPLGDF